VRCDGSGAEQRVVEGRSRGLATDSRVVDQIIESQPSQARFFAGVVLWNQGELAEELRRGLWFVQEPRSEIVLRKPAGLWEELVDRLEKAAKAI